MAIELDVATRLSTNLVHVYKLFGSVRHHAPRFHEAIEPTAYPLLFALGVRPMRVSEIADAIHSDLSVVSRQVSHLADLGIVEKRPDESDGRASVIALSDEGSEAIRRMQDSRGHWFQELMTGWEPADAEAFDAFLVQFIDTLDGQICQLRSGPKSPSTSTTTHP
ncbi:MarR family winged helix-turn-helix transcriptional regulator [Leekyejoonella antrihumi]|uniref:MarR family transcriptional regulator n=1 Tax=Leekyejoonella antrihumi TaxID=1660198 RepID=A0A563E6W1_9MICO|nr:MarR family transcriptional regulator [Leekyejoonella antrihumi]TWP37951.1 MarR family transcriptional regulator [Leekyejoonella antrihumi]